MNIKITPSQETPLPCLRPDIEIFAGPLEDDGSPAYMIHDPVTGTYNKIGWSEAVILNRLKHGMTLTLLINELNEQTTLNVEPEDVAVLCDEARKLGLTMDSLVRPARDLTNALKTKKVGFLKWLIQHYMYFRIPLFHSDEFLTKTLPLVRPLISRQALIVYFFFACAGFYFLSQRFELYCTTFTHFFSVQGIIAYITVIFFLKTAHELGHAFVAKSYAVRVPTMGIAFMFFTPVAYSDVTDAWRLRNRKGRLAIALAGIKTELIIGAVALTIWGITPPGILNSICFLLSSTTLLATFIVNLNPAMRFDGYYILSDLWGIDNLSSEAGNFTKWFLRKKLLGIDAVCPISKQNIRRQLQMLFYSFYAWTYRFFLYLGIAVVVYFKFTKVLGIILFAYEILLFIVRPIINEIRVVIDMKKQIIFSWKLCMIIAVAICIAGWMCLPLSRVEIAPAVLHPARSQTIYAPIGCKVEKIYVKQGDIVTKGDILARLVSESLDTEIEYLSVSVKQFENYIKSLSMDYLRVGMIPEIKKQMAAMKEKRAGLNELQNQLVIKSKISGRVVGWDQLIVPGCFVKNNQEIGCVASTNKIHINAFIAEKKINYLTIGQIVVFYSSDYSNQVQGVIKSIDPIREMSVDILSIGAEAVRELPLIFDQNTGRHTIVESYFKAWIAVDHEKINNLRLGESGHVRYKTKKRSLLFELLLYCYSVLIRESNF